VVGLHGTSEPGLVPGRPSHGCIRLRNTDITRLYRLVPRGTPLHVI
jgi:lipoprotein-anchoring transpeptidase ErfK/SrfK